MNRRFSMSAIDDLGEEWDRMFFTAASVLAEPFCAIYETFRYRLVSPLGDKFDNKASRIHEFSIRCLIGLGTILTAALITHVGVLTLVISTGLLCTTFRCVGVLLQKNGFSYTRGTAPEISLQNKEMSAMIWDIRGSKGGASYKEGVVHWRSRVDRILENITKENPDLLILQGVHDTALMDRLAKGLSNQYAHIFTHLGADAFGNSSGMMIVSKCALHDFVQEKEIATLELKGQPECDSPCIRFLIAPQAEWQSLTDILKTKSHPLPTFFAGHTAPSPYTYDCFDGPTHTSELSRQWSAQQASSEEHTRISLFKHLLPDGTPLPTIERNVSLTDCRIVEGYDETHNTQTALSSDQGLVALLSGL